MDMGYPAGRLSADFLDRLLAYGDRVVALAERLARDRRPPRVIDQLIGSGTSPGAHVFEAHEAISRRDFRKDIGGAAKELSETSFWLRLIVRRQWLSAEQVEPLLKETNELLRILKTMRARTKL